MSGINRLPVLHCCGKSMVACVLTFDRTFNVFYFYVHNKNIFASNCYSVTIQYSASDVFKLLTTKYKKSDLFVGASFFEIYSGKVSLK
jgi:hypothetical protein